MKHDTKERDNAKRLFKNLQKIFLLVCTVFFFVGADTSITQAAPKLNVTNCTLFENDMAELKVTGYKGMIEWNSSNKNVATIFEGLIEANKSGKTVITAKCGRKILKCKLTVMKEKKYSIESNTLKICDEALDSRAYVGDMYDFALDNNGRYFIHRFGKNEDNGIWETYDAEKGELITWSSSNESVAKVTQDGLVFFNKPGYVTITAKTKSGKAKVGFNVRSAIPSIEEKRNILQAVAKKVKKAGAKKVVLGETDKSAIWTEYEQSVYSQIYGGRHLSKQAYFETQSGGTFSLNNADELDDAEFMKNYIGETVTLYYSRSFSGGLLYIHFWDPLYL